MLTVEGAAAYSDMSNTSTCLRETLDIRCLMLVFYTSFFLRSLLITVSWLKKWHCKVQLWVPMSHTISQWILIIIWEQLHAISSHKGGVTSLMVILASAFSDFSGKWLPVLLLCDYRWAQPHLPSAVCVCVDQHLDIKAIWTAHSEAQPAHPPQLGSLRSGREELPGKQTTGGSGASGERAVSRCHVRNLHLTSDLPAKSSSNCT